jgi:hypothetical protein
VLDSPIHKGIFLLLQKLTGSRLVRKFSTFYGTRRCTTTFTRARHVLLSCEFLYTIEIFTLLGCYVAYVPKYLTTTRGNLAVPSSMTAIEDGNDRLSGNVGTTSLRSATSQRNEIHFYASWRACPLKTKSIVFPKTSVTKYK